MCFAEDKETGVGVMSAIARRASRSEFGRRALEEQADLSLFRERPSPRIIAGLVIIGFSYLIGWPAVALFAALSILFREPLIAAIGGPAIYGISHLVFWIGFYMTGAPYAYAFLRWAARKFLERYLTEDELDHVRKSSAEMR